MGRSTAAAEGAVAHAYAIRPGVQTKRMPRRRTVTEPVARGLAANGPTTTTVISHMRTATAAWIARLRHGAVAYVVATCRSRSRRATTATWGWVVGGGVVSGGKRGYY